MNTTSVLRVETDERIRQNPEWHEAVNQASSFFDERYEPQAEVQGPPPTLIWAAVERGGQPYVRCEFRESDDLGTRTYTPQMFWLPQLLDQTARNYILLGYIHHILGKRMDARTVRIRELIDQLDAEGER